MKKEVIFKSLLIFLLLLVLIKYSIRPIIGLALPTTELKIKY